MTEKSERCDLRRTITVLAGFEDRGGNTRLRMYSRCRTFAWRVCETLGSMLGEQNIVQ